VYDAAGDLTSIPGIAAYNYDAESRLCSVGGTSCTTGTVYTYDGDGRRVMKSGGKIYWYGTGSDPLVETDLSGAWQFTHYYFGGMRIARRESNNWVDHYGLDHLGNARIVYGNNGGWDQSDFYPFGGERVISSAAGSRYKFTGKERDAESGLDNFGARYDSSQYGRFMSPDWSAKAEPVPYAKLDNPQSLNLYAYVLNNPVSRVDADGHDDEEPYRTTHVPTVVFVQGGFPMEIPQVNLRNFNRSGRNCICGGGGFSNLFNRVVSGVLGVGNMVFGGGKIVEGVAEVSASVVTVVTAATGTYHIVNGSGQTTAGAHQLHYAMTGDQTDLDKADAAIANTTISGQIMLRSGVDVKTAAAISGVVENDVPTVFGAEKASEKVLTLIDWANKLQDSSSPSQ
jgi:RHS repeat-associated protein